MDWLRYFDLLGDRITIQRIDGNVSISQTSLEMNTRYELTY